MNNSNLKVVFAVLPVRSVSGKWIWFDFYYVEIDYNWYKPGEINPSTKRTRYTADEYAQKIRDKYASKEK